MSTSLTTIPVAKRRQVAATLGLFAVLFIAVGAVAATGPDTAIVRAFVIVALVVAVLLGLLAWGVVHSVRVDRAAQDDLALDAVIADTVTRTYGSMCECGHEHDPTELHVTDAPSECGSATDCAHDCASCLLVRAGTAERQDAGSALVSGNAGSALVPDVSAVSAPVLAADSALAPPAAGRLRPSPTLTRAERTTG